VAGAVITVTTAGGRQLTCALTSPEGRYRISGLPAEALTVIVTARGHDPAAAALLMQAGAATERNFVLAGSGGLSGTVRSAGSDGAPLAGAKVVISDLAGHVVASAVTGGTGEFSVDGAPSGTYSLTATAAGHLPASREVELNGHPETAQLALPLAREAHGLVRAPGGEPVPGILVTAANAAGEIAASAITDADGWYRLTGLGEGEHVLVAGGHEPVRTRVDVISGETVSVTVRVGASPALATQSPAQPAPEDAQPWRGSGAASGPAEAPGTGPADGQASWADLDGMTSQLGMGRSGE
jgi:hypothetical protein